MREVRKHRGVTYSVPHNDDGTWHFKVHPPRKPASSLRPESTPVTGYRTREAAVKAAERAIDEWLRRGRATLRPPHTEA
jgi:hypothetical protein